MPQAGSVDAWHGESIGPAFGPPVVQPGTDLGKFSVFCNSCRRPRSHLQKAMAPATTPLTARPNTSVPSAKLTWPCSQSGCGASILAQALCCPERRRASYETTAEDYSRNTRYPSHVDQTSRFTYKGRAGILQSSKEESILGLWRPKAKTEA